MRPSTKRALRTAYQVVLSLVVIVPVLVSTLPITAQVTTIVAAVAAMAKVVNALEDAGMIPAWLKVTAEVVAADLPKDAVIVSVAVPVPEDPVS